MASGKIENLTCRGRYKTVEGAVRKLAIRNGDCVVFCRDCGLTFVIDANAPLNEALPGHVWNGNGVRHPTHEDWLDEQAEKELCPECGCYPCEHTPRLI